MQPKVLETKNLCKTIDGVEILRNINFTARQGEKIALIGESGAGKTSLLQILGMMDSASSGEFFLRGELASSMSDREKTNKRLHDIGFVYQFHHLIEEMSVRENILTPLALAGNHDHTKILELVERLGLTGLLDRAPHTLSGGEKQRISVLRAVANFPWLLLADEPTGNLDSLNTDIIIDLFLELADTYNMTLIIVTHNHDIAKRMDRVVHMKDGVIVEITSPSP